MVSVLLINVPGLGNSNPVAAPSSLRLTEIGIGVISMPARQWLQELGNFCSWPKCMPMYSQHKREKPCHILS